MLIYKLHTAIIHHLKLAKACIHEIIVATNDIATVLSHFESGCGK